MEIIHDAVERLPQAHPDVDPRSGLIFNGYIESRRTVVLAQPTEWSGPGIELATQALEALHRTLAALSRASDLSTGDRIRHAFDTTNTEIIEQSQSQAGHDPDRRIGIGATIVQVDGEIATIGLMPPTQVLLWQDGRLTWCPTRESWTGQQAGLTGSPLGWAKEPQPTVVATAVNQRDEIVLTTDTLARCLAQNPATELRSTEALCARIEALGSDPTADAMPLMAVATRLIAPTVSGTLGGVTRQTLVQFEGRVRSAWTALRKAD